MIGQESNFQLQRKSKAGKVWSFKERLDGHANNQSNVSSRLFQETHLNFKKKFLTVWYHMDVNPLKLGRGVRNVLFGYAKLSVRTLSPSWLKNERKKELWMTDIRDGNRHKDKQSKLHSSLIQGIFHIVVPKWHFAFGWRNDWAP